MIILWTLALSVRRGFALVATLTGILCGIAMGATRNLAILAVTGTKAVLSLSLMVILGQSVRSAMKTTE